MFSLDADPRVWSEEPKMKRKAVAVVRVVGRHPLAPQTACDRLGQRRLILNYQYAHVNTVSQFPERNLMAHP